MAGQSTRNGSRILYLTYDGLTDPLGQSQVLPYLTRLSALGHAITIVSFEKGHRSAAREAVAALCHAAGIDWHPLPYTKHPPVLSTVRNIRRMRVLAERLHHQRPFDIVHCRSDLPALVGRKLKQAHGLPWVFDMRGFWADERVDGGLWNLANPLYRSVHSFFKRRERQFLSEAGAIISLTHAAADFLERERPAVPIDIVPCCADLDHFQPATAAQRAAARAELGIAPHVRVAAYLGSVGTWYMLGEMLDAFAVQLSREPAARMLWITPDDPAFILGEARRRGIPPQSLLIRRAERPQVPALLAAADYGLFFIKPVFSKIASSPVKLGEMMAMGLPVLTNGGVGDVEQILRESSAGVTVERFDRSAYGEAFVRLEQLHFDEDRQRDAVRRWFDLAEGVRRYDAIYRRLQPASVS